MQLRAPGYIPNDTSLGDEKWQQMTRYTVFVTATLLVAYLGWYLHKHSDFNNDDLDNFLLSQRSGFWEFVTAPTNVHYVPLHRFLSWLVYRLAPMNYSVAIAIVLAFHVGTVIVLARSLSLLRVGQIAGLIVCGYAGSSLIIYGLVWWANAQHRVTYVFFDICAIYSYLAWMKHGRRIHLLSMAVVFVLAFGVYEKAIFIPLHMLLIGYLSDERSFRSRIKQFLIPPFCGFFLAFVYVVSYLLLNRGAAHIAFLQAMLADEAFAKTFFVAAFGLGGDATPDTLMHGTSLRLLCLIALFSGALLVSLWRGRGSWKIVLAAVALVMLESLPVVLSSRYTALLPIVTHQSRYSYEELQLLALLMGIWCKRIGLVNLSRTGSRWAWSVGFVLVLAYSATSVSYERTGLRKPYDELSISDNSHRYLSNLRFGVSQIRDEAPVFQNDKVPGYISLLGSIPDTRTLLPLLLPNANFNNKANPRYGVLQDGRVIRLY
jgi:hypothetical protein